MRTSVKIDSHGIVTLVEEKIVRTTTLEEFSKQFERTVSSHPHIISKDTVFVRSNGDLTIVVLEEEPSFRTILYRPAGRMEGDEIEVRVSLPYLYHFLSFDESRTRSVHIRSSKSKVTDINTDLYIAPLLNIYDTGSGNLCTGNAILLDVDLSLSDKCDQYLDLLWGTVWQHDLRPWVPSGMTSYAEYIIASERNPLLWMDINYESIRGSSFKEFSEEKLND